MKEERDLYNRNKVLTGEKCYKGSKIPDNRYIIVVTLFVQNNKGELLLQKRSKKKGGKYGFISGHPKSGETSIQGIITEAKEEIGIEINEKELKLFNTEETTNTFFDFYYLKNDINISNLVIQKEEVEDVKWFSIPEIYDLIEKGDFFKNHIEAFEIIINYLKKGMNNYPLLS